MARGTASGCDAGPPRGATRHLGHVAEPDRDPFAARSDPDRATIGTSFSVESSPLNRTAFDG